MRLILRFPKKEERGIFTQDWTMRRFWKSTGAPPFENSPLPPCMHIRIMRVVALNALLIGVALALIAIAGEAYFRLIVVPDGYGFSVSPKDFVGHNAWRFVPNVGVMLEPNSEARFANHLDYWTITRTNGLGFLDREPISPERAAESCHVTIIGDSYIEAREVPIADKAQVKLEEIAARELPHLNITASAFGLTGYGQINQLAFYDEYARHLRPNVVALVFVNNDFVDNSNILNALSWGMDPDHMPMVSAERNESGALELRPPDPDYEAFRPPPPSRAQSSNADRDVKSYIEFFAKRAIESAKTESAKHSYFAQWLDAKIETFSKAEAHHEKVIWRAEMLSQRPIYSDFFQNWMPTRHSGINLTFTEIDLPPIFEDALAYTEFGLEQFKRRAERDGARLAILAIHRTKVNGELPFARLIAMADALDIPVIEQYDYILRIGADPKHAEWKHDPHWNEDGHRWAAEALLEWLRNNQDVCNERG